MLLSLIFQVFNFHACNQKFSGLSCILIILHNLIIFSISLVVCFNADIQNTQSHRWKKHTSQSFLLSQMLGFLLTYLTSVCTSIIRENFELLRFGLFLWVGKFKLFIIVLFSPPSVRPPLDPEDEELLRDDEAVTPVKKDGIKRKERPTDKGVAWLVKTQYISPLSMESTKQVIDQHTTLGEFTS